MIEDAISGLEAAYKSGAGKVIAIASMEKTEIYEKIPYVSQIIKNFDEIDRNLFEIPVSL